MTYRLQTVHNIRPYPSDLLSILLSKL